MDEAERTQSDLEVDRDIRRLVQGAKSQELASDEHEASRKRVAAMLFGPDEDDDDESGDAPPTETKNSREPEISQIHRYEVRKLIGSGAMGRVFEAYDPKLARPLAIKVLHPGYSDEAKARARIVREAQSLARLSHPNVIQVYDVGDSEVGFFIAMEWVWGDTLRKVVKESKPEQWRTIMQHFLDAGEGLAAAHNANLVHRDFKPENVIVGHDCRVRVLDFGLARPSGPGSIPRAEIEAAQQSLSGERKQMGLTQTGAMIGTPIYMAPELYMGGTADAKSDQFAYCVALFDALYRQRPFDGNNVESYAKAVVAGELCAPPANPELRCPESLLAIIQKGLSVEPKERYATMADLLKALREAIALPVPAQRRRRRNFAVLLGACLLTAVVVSQVRGLPFSGKDWGWFGEDALQGAAAKKALADAGALFGDGSGPGPSPTGGDANSIKDSGKDSGAAPGGAGDEQGSKPSAPGQDKPVPADEKKAEPRKSAQQTSSNGSKGPSVKGRTKPSKKPSSEARRSGWCSLHEDTYRLLRRDRRRKSRFRARGGSCFSCRIEARRSRTRQFHPRDCQGYQLCGPTKDEQCSP